MSKEFANPSSESPFLSVNLDTLGPIPELPFVTIDEPILTISAIAGSAKRMQKGLVIKPRERRPAKPKRLFPPPEWFSESENSQTV